MRKAWLTFLFIIALSVSAIAQVQTFTRDGLSTRWICLPLHGVLSRV